MTKAHIMLVKGRDILRKVFGLSSDEQTDDETEETQNTAKDLDDQDLDEETRVSGICQCCSRTGNSDRDTTEQVTETDSETSPEQGES